MKKFNKKGFTIVELVIVIAVIAILMGIMFIGGTAISNNAKQATMDSDLRSFEVDLKAYINDPANNKLVKGIAPAAAAAEAPAEWEALMNQYLEDDMALKTASGSKSAFTKLATVTAAQMKGDAPASMKAETNMKDPFGVNYQMVVLDNSTTAHTDLAFLVISYGKNKQTDATNGLGLVLDKDDVALVVRIVDSVIYTGISDGAARSDAATTPYWQAVSQVAGVAATGITGQDYVAAP